MKQELCPYDFYQLHESTRANMVGHSFKKNEGIYYVVKLPPHQFNYGINQGLLLLNKPRRLYLKQCKDRDRELTPADLDWFNVYSFSPDDLDCSLDLSGKQLYFSVKKYLDKFPFCDMTYKQMIINLQNKFGGETYIEEDF